ncbi:MAG: YcaO-like family protein, partial [Spirochaetaceae bacterium]|nr:YcaO-like family protein [Spirochaetaceae bacterium]
MPDVNDYEKYKDAKPEDTVERIQKILKQTGIATTETWGVTNIKNCHYLRVAICGSNFGTNGKGATREFALASGYAEFMERLQTEYYYTGEYSEKTHNEYGFYYAPDEKYVNTEEIAKESNPWIDLLLDKLLSEMKKENA